MTIEQIKYLREATDKVEFKEATSQYSYSSKRQSLLGYVTALANEGGGAIIFGVRENKDLPHEITGSRAWEGREVKLEQDVFHDLQIRVKTLVLREDQKRVLVVTVPRRPVGKVLRFQEVPLMRVGEDLVSMNDDMLREILSEQEPDFSARFCPGLTMEDLHPTALEIMKGAYALKQRNPRFNSLSDEQMLRDLHLMVEEKLNYAALLLLGRRSKIEQFVPQAKMIWEFRYAEGQIAFDFRDVVQEPIFIAIELIWGLINSQNAGAAKTTAAYIFPIPTFNEAVIREAVLNAIAHRDYSIGSEVVIKQYPKKMVISNPGGFPKGVTLDNLLTVNSTPRSRLMAEVLEKTGLVERSGQGVDKIFSITLAEGKPEPDYKDSDNYQVALKLDGNVTDKAFSAYIEHIQKSRDDWHKLGVEEIIGLHKVKQGLFGRVKESILASLEKQGLVAKSTGASNRYSLSDPYAALAEKEQRIGSRYLIAEVELFVTALQGKLLRIGELEGKLSGALNRNQIKYLITKLMEDGVVGSEGMSRGTRYYLNFVFDRAMGDTMVEAVISLLRSREA